MVAVDSQHENAYVEAIKPTRTRESDREENLALSTKIAGTRGMSASVTPGPHSVGGITFTATKTKEKGEVLEKKRYNSGIADHHRDGIVRWSFNVDDDNFQKWGINMEEDVLPSVSFEFVGPHNEVPAPPPTFMDIVISSHWSMILSSEWNKDSSWFAKLFHPRRFNSLGNTQTMYSNLFQLVAMKTVPSNLPERSHYKAKVEVRSGASGDPKVTDRKSVV